MGRNCSAVHGIGPPPISTYSTPSCLTARMALSLRSRPFTGAPILGVRGPSLGIPGPRFQVFSAATDKPGATAATEPAATCFIKLRREREELICAPSKANTWDRRQKPAMSPLQLNLYGLAQPVDRIGCAASSI